jgi:hypothetical protein
MVDWDKELKEAKLRLLKRVYLKAMLKVQKDYKEGGKRYV